MKRKHSVVVAVLGAAVFLMVVLQVIGSRIRLQEHMATACKCNQLTLEMWKVDWYMETGDTRAPEVSNILAYSNGRSMPICPASGAYVLGPHNKPIWCPVHGSVDSPRRQKWWERTRKDRTKPSNTTSKPAPSAASEAVQG